MKRITRKARKINESLRGRIEFVDCWLNLIELSSACFQTGRVKHVSTHRVYDQRQKNMSNERKKKKMVSYHAHDNG